VYATIAIAAVLPPQPSPLFADFAALHRIPSLVLGPMFIVSVVKKFASSAMSCPSRILLNMWRCPCRRGDERRRRYRFRLRQKNATRRIAGDSVNSSLRSTLMPLWCLCHDRREDVEAIVDGRIALAYLAREPDRLSRCSGALVVECQQGQ
jgi:hypothetical protein